MSQNKVRILVESALMIALATILELLPFPSWPHGGSISVSMVPILYLSFRHGIKWGLLSSLVYSIIQMITGFYAPPAGTIFAFFLCVMLDYVIAFGVLGLADIFTKPFKKKILGYGVGSFVVIFARFVCHFLSGMLIWQSYATEGQPIWLYSLTVNGGYMIPNMFLDTALIVLLCLALNPKTLKPMTSAKATA